MRPAAMNEDGFLCNQKGEGKDWGHSASRFSADRYSKATEMTSVLSATVFLRDSYLPLSAFPWGGFHQGLPGGE